MLKEFKSDNNGGYMAIITINETPTEIEIINDTNQDGIVNWKNVQKILDTLRENFKKIDEKSRKLLRLYVDNSGLYSEADSRLIKGFSLSSISINSSLLNRPFLTKHNFQYTLNYDWEADFWVDTYGYYEVYILYQNIEGIRRIQR